MPWYTIALMVSGSILLLFGIGGGLFVMRGLAQWMSK